MIGAPTRRQFLATVVAATVPTGAVVAGSSIEPPTNEELEHYYAFLWGEFFALSEELGVEMHDAWIAHKSGGYDAYQDRFGHVSASTRARAILAMGRST